MEEGIARKKRELETLEEDIREFRELEHFSTEDAQELFELAQELLELQQKRDRAV